MPKKFVTIAGIVIAVIAVVVGIGAVTKQPAPQGAPQRQEERALDQRATPADRHVSMAQAIITRAPKSPDGYNALAAAYTQKARETGDFGYYARVEATLKRSFEVAPDNHDATRMQAYLLLAYHRFNEALQVARRAVEQKPKDYEAYGAVVDALVELGRYDEAKRAVQAMLDVRPYTASYARASYLRSLYGDTEGAIEAMRLAVQSANPGDPELVAWCRVHLGDELMNAGKRAEAEREYDHALFLFPDYHLALAAKARARLAANDTDGAVEFYKRAQERIPSPETAIALGDIYAKSGRAEDAKKQFELVEFIERTGAEGGTYSRQLALFWADHDVKLDEALAVARREREARSDIYTSDVLAWCLYKKGQYAEAKTAIEEALRLGTRDAGINYHAGMIYRALGDRRAAAKHLQLALKINPSFDVLQADVARQALRSLAA
ncbi:MAG TPA: tetratricopeptide repeat protein [Pyrinomonadaceae bacterium]|nr:tetratricopeptide repeat protein [Pyrinomonadaceae bacterium]